MINTQGPAEYSVLHLKIAFQYLSAFEFSDFGISNLTSPSTPQCIGTTEKYYSVTVAFT